MMTHCHRCGQHWDLIWNNNEHAGKWVISSASYLFLKYIFFGADIEVIS